MMQMLASQSPTPDSDCCVHYNVHYIDMIQGITGFHLYLLCLVEKAKTRPQAENEIYGEEMYPDQDLETDVAAILASGLHKTPSLQHLEATVFMLTCENIKVEDYDMFGTLLHVLLYNKQIKSFKDILQIIDASNLQEIRTLHMHMASIVAFHHYIRVEVHRTGSYKAKKTVDTVLESYKLIMIKGLLKTQLSKQACDHVEKWRA